MSNLTDEARDQIRQYMIKIVVIPGFLLSMASAVAGYVIHGVGQREAYIDSFREFSDSVVESAKQASASAATAELLRIRIDSDARAIDDLRRKIDASSALMTADATVDEIVKKLVIQPGFQDRIAVAAISKFGSSGEKIKQPMVGGNKNGWTATSSCPDGYYVSGISGQDHDLGERCYDCMSRFSVICSPLINK